MQEEPNTYQAYPSLVFMWAGFLPAGKHDILIYDRYRAALWHTRVVIDVADEQAGQALEHRHSGCFTYTPEPFPAA